MFQIGDSVNLVPYAYVRDGIVPDIGIGEMSWEQTYNDNPHIISSIDGKLIYLKGSIFTWSEEDFEIHIENDVANIDDLI